MLNNLNQFKWQITPNPNEKQREREREREREIHKICSKKRKWKRKPGGADQLERGDRKSDGAKGWGVLRVLSPFASEVFFSSIPLLLPFLSLSLSYYSLCLCVCLCDSIFMYECMYSFLPSFVKTQMKVHFVCLIRVSLAGTHCPATPTSTACFQIITLTLSILLFLISYLILSSKKFTSKT